MQRVGGQRRQTQVQLRHEPCGGGGGGGGPKGALPALPPPVRPPTSLTDFVTTWRLATTPPRARTPAKGFDPHACRPGGLGSCRGSPRRSGGMGAGRSRSPRGCWPLGSSPLALRHRVPALAICPSSCCDALFGPAALPNAGAGRPFRHAAPACTAARSLECPY